MRNDNNSLPIYLILPAALGYGCHAMTIRSRRIMYLVGKAVAGA
jgi:hypothetical protein